jgi:DNA primase
VRADRPDVVAKMKSYGLVNDKGESVFAGRYIVPIKNINGIIVGFIGRLPDSEVDDRHPKYINSIDSALFHKRAVFFNPQGLMEASSEVIVVEGVFDALSYIAAGVKNVVSPMGCSLSDAHLKMLKAFSKKGTGKTIVLSFDKDEAGTIATERAIGYIRDLRVNVSAADFKGKKDANDVLLSLGSSYLAQTASASVPAPEYIIDLYKSTKRLDTIQGKENLWRVLAKFLGSYERDYRDSYPLNQAYTPVTFNLFWKKYSSAVDTERADA